MSTKSQEMLDKCVVDGNFFTARPGKKTCSPECKRKLDSENRRLRKQAVKDLAAKAQADADAKREARNAKRRKANQVQYETPEEAAEWTAKPNWKVLAFYAALVVFVILLIANIPNGK